MNIEITKEGKVFVDGVERKQSIRSKNSPYLCVGLNKKMYNVHRLVAEKFIPNPNNLPQVNHKNGIKTDNRVENLEWVSVRENVIHRYKVLNHKHKSDYLRVLEDKIVQEIRNEYSKNEITMKELSETYNVSTSTIHRIIHHKLDY